VTMNTDTNTNINPNTITVTAKVVPGEEIPGRVGYIQFTVQYGPMKINLIYLDLTYYLPQTYRSFGTDKNIKIGNWRSTINKRGNKIRFKSETDGHADTEFDVELPADVCLSAFMKIADDVEKIQNTAQTWMRNVQTETEILNDTQIRFTVRGLDSYPERTSRTMDIEWKKIPWSRLDRQVIYDSDEAIAIHGIRNHSITKDRGDKKVIFKLSNYAYETFCEIPIQACSGIFSFMHDKCRELQNKVDAVSIMQDHSTSFWTADNS